MGSTTPAVFQDKAAAIELFALGLEFVRPTTVEVHDLPGVSGQQQGVGELTQLIAAVAFIGQGQSGFQHLGIRVKTQVDDQLQLSTRIVAEELHPMPVQCRFNQIELGRPVITMATPFQTGSGKQAAGVFRAQGDDSVGVNSGLWYRVVVGLEKRIQAGTFRQALAPVEHLGQRCVCLDHQTGSVGIEMNQVTHKAGFPKVIARQMKNCPRNWGQHLAGRCLSQQSGSDCAALLEALVQTVGFLVDDGTEQNQDGRNQDHQYFQTNDGFR